MGGTSRWAGGVVAVLVFAALGVGFWSQARGDAGPGPTDAVRAPTSTGPSEPDRSDVAAVPAPAASSRSGEPSGPAESEAVGSSGTVGSSEAVGSERAEPAPSPEAGPAEGPWAELLPAARVSHPDTDPDTAFPWDLVGYFREGDPTGFDGGNPSGDWTNKAEIWDSLAPVLRAEVAALGEPTDDPVFPEADPNEARGQTRWSTETTEGRGELVEFLAQYQEANGDVVDRIKAALVVTSDDGSGTVVAVMETFELRKADYPGFIAYNDAVAAREWEWVLRQGSQP